MRTRCSCPDCGYILDRLHPIVKETVHFDCPRCQAHYSHDDFWAEQEEKWQAMHHNHAKADLSGEERA